ncbi:unnamed protein product [Lymnaea stagnalis]|uniref:N-acetyltransferase domain-containing protein n=1 Tax=Lymnaea stagnalis TaxID=6523 RepID=A0AAV2HKY0_LYMST
MFRVLQFSKLFTAASSFRGHLVIKNFCELHLYQLLHRNQILEGSSQIRLLRSSACQQIFNNRDSMSSVRQFDRTTDLSRFLIEIGTDPKEARYWLKNFKSSVESSEVFMVVCVENDVMENQALLETFSSSISFLYRNCMSPLIVCGSGSKQTTFKEMKDACIQNALRLNDLLERHGAYTRVLYPGCGVVTGESLLHGEPGNTHQLNVSTEIIKSSLASQHLPIVLSYGETAAGQIFAIKPWDLTAQMSRLLQPKKVMFINSHGGFLDEHGKVIANINLPTDLATVDQKCWYTPEIINTMSRVNQLLSDLPTDSSVVITSADTMLSELFSHRGSGTFFRSTESIHKYTSLEGIDLVRLRLLLDKSFMKSIVDSYFEDISSQIHAIYLCESYSGVAIILKSERTHVPYMCKFAVTNRAQGQGTGEMLWDRLIQSEPRLFWRSKTDNPINTWYFKKCEGSHNNHMWLVFWYGILDPNLSAGLIKDAVSRADSFVPNGFITGIGSDDEEERMGG